MVLGAKGVGLIISIVGDVSGLDKSLGEAAGDIKGFGGVSLKTAAQVSVVAGAAIVAGEAIYGMAKAADADRTEQAKLAKAIEQAGAATASTTAQVDAAIAAGQEKAFTDSQTRDALQTLVTATKDVGAATDLLTQAQDLARFAGVDLATASDAVAKAHAGNDKALRSLVPGLEKGATAADTLAEASGRAAGQADIFAKSADGMEARAGDSFSELAETIGEVFLPILDAIMPALIPILKAFGELVKALLPLLVPLIKLLGAALTVVAKVLVTVVEWIVKLVEWVTKLLSPLTSVLDKLGKLSGLGGIIGKVTGNAASGATTFGAQAATGSAGGVQINIYGDPSVIEARVVKALQDYTRRNGISAIIPSAR